MEESFTPSGAGHPTFKLSILFTARRQSSQFEIDKFQVYACSPPGKCAHVLQSYMFHSALWYPSLSNAVVWHSHCYILFVCIMSYYIIGIKDIFECFMMVLNYRAAALKPRSPKG